MTGAHLHLLINHFPVIGLIFAIILLILAYLKPTDGYLRSALVILVVAGALAVPTYFSGEPAEDTIEKLSSFSKPLVHEHEEAGEFAIIFMSITGLLAAAALYFSFKTGKIPKALLIGVVALTLFTLTVVARTNYLGGKIGHVELRDGIQPPATGGTEEPKN
jgi:uncharacterized membrane protein